MNIQKIKPYITEEEIQLGIKHLGEKLNELYKNEEVYMICVLKGGAFFGVDLAKSLTMPLKIEFIRLSSYGSSTVSSGKVRGLDVSLPDLSGKNVIIAEDIIDTGHTAKFLIDYINDKYKTKSLLFCALLNKKARREIDIEADYYCFDVDDKFLIGYGLDFDEQYRNLPYIGTLKE